MNESKARGVKMFETKRSYVLIEQYIGNSYKILGTSRCSGDSLPIVYAEEIHEDILAKGAVSAIDLNQKYTFIAVSVASGPIRVRPMSFDKLTAEQASDALDEFV